MENTFAVLSSKDIWETIRHYTKPIYAYQYSGEFRSFTNSIYYDERIVILFYDGDKLPKIKASKEVQDKFMKDLQEKLTKALTEAIDAI